MTESNLVNKICLYIYLKTKQFQIGDKNQSDEKKKKKPLQVNLISIKKKKVVCIVYGALQKNKSFILFNQRVLNLGYNYH